MWAWWASVRRFAADRTGGIAVLFGLAAVPVTTLVFGAIDFSMRVTTRTAVQAAADAAALAGVRLLTPDLGVDRTELRRRSVQDAERVARANLERLLGSRAQVRDVAVAVTRGPRVEVTVTVHQPSLIPVSLFPNETTVVGRAAAGLSTEDLPACIIAVAPDASYGVRVVGDGFVKGTNCTVWSNNTGDRSIEILQSGKIEAERLCAAGTGNETSRRHTNPPLEENCRPLRPPPPLDLGAQTAGACTATGTVITDRAQVTLTPGIYCDGLVIDADRVQLLPGRYVLRNGRFVVRGRTIVRGNDVSILLGRDAANVIFEGLSDLELSAPSGGQLRGMLFAEDGPPSSRRLVVMRGGADLNAAGTILLHGSEVHYLGKTTTSVRRQAMTMVAASVTVGGEARLEVRHTRRPSWHAIWVLSRAFTPQLMR